VSQHRPREASLADAAVEADLGLLSWLHGFSKARKALVAPGSRTCLHLQAEEAL